MSAITEDKKIAYATAAPMNKPAYSSAPINPIPSKPLIRYAEAAPMNRPTYSAPVQPMPVKKMSYAEKLKKLQDESTDIIKHIGSKRYNRYQNFYEMMAQVEQYNINLDDIAPYYSGVRQLMDTENDFKRKHGNKAFEKTFSMWYNASDVDRERIKSAIKILSGDKNNWDASILEHNKELQENYKYDENDPEDVLRAYLGKMPKSFADEEARKIVDEADAIREQTGQPVSALNDKSNPNPWARIIKKRVPTKEELQDALITISLNYTSPEEKQRQELKNSAAQGFMADGLGVADAYKLANDRTPDFIRADDLNKNVKFRPKAASDFGQAGGNVDMEGRPILEGQDGSAYSFDPAVTQMGDKYYVIPRVFKNADGVWVHGDDKTAAAHAMTTGEQMGVFDTQEEAAAYADAVRAKYDKPAPPSREELAQAQEEAFDEELKQATPQELEQRLKTEQGDRAQKIKAAYYGKLSDEELDRKIQDAKAAAKQAQDAYILATGDEQMVRSEQTTAKANEAQAAKNAADAALEELQNAKWERDHAQKLDAITEPVFNAPDYKETIAKVAKISDIKLFNDRYGKIIATINNPAIKEYAKQVSALPDGIALDPTGSLVKSVLGGVITADTKYAYMTPEQADVIRYLYGKEDYRGIDEYLKLIDRDLNEAKTKGDIAIEQAKYDALGGGAPARIAAGIESVRTGFNTPAAVLDAMGRTAAQSWGGAYEKPDPYSPMQQPVIKKQAQREYATKDASPVVKMVINSGLDLVDFATKLPFGATGAAAYIAAQAAGDTVQDVLQRGGSYRQATSEAIISGAINFMTAKIPVERLLKLKPDKSLMQNIKNILANAGIEASLNTVQSYADIITDRKIMGDKSNYELYKQNLIAEGMTAQEAEKQAGIEFFVNQPLQAAIQGFAMGAIPAGLKVFGARMAKTMTNAVIKREVRRGNVKAKFKADMDTVTGGDIPKIKFKSAQTEQAKAASKDFLPKGTPVWVDGKAGKVEHHNWGGVHVVFEDGTEARKIPREKVEVEAPKAEAKTETKGDTQGKEERQTESFYTEDEYRDFLKNKYNGDMTKLTPDEIDNLAGYGEGKKAPKPQEAPKAEQPKQETMKQEAEGASKKGGLEPFDERETERLEAGGKNVVNKGKDDWKNFTKLAEAIKESKRFFFGRVSKNLSEFVKSRTGIDIEGMKVSANLNELRHMTKHAEDGEPLTQDAIERLPEVFDNPDEAVLSDHPDFAGRTAFKLTKKINGYLVTVNGVAINRNTLFIDTAYMKRRPVVADVQAPARTSETSHGRPSKENIPNNSGENKTENKGESGRIPTKKGRIVSDRFNDKLKGQAGAKAGLGDKKATGAPNFKKGASYGNDFSGTSYGQGKRRTSKVALSSLEATSDETLRQNIGDGLYDYVSESPNVKYDQEYAYVKQRGLQGVIDDYAPTEEVTKNGRTIAREKQYSDRDTARITAALAQAFEAKDKAAQQHLMAIAVDMGISQGRSVNMWKMLKRLNPDGYTIYLKRRIARLNAEGRRVFRSKWKDFDLTDAEIETLKNGKTEADWKAAEKKIYERIADEMPATWTEKSAAWRRIAMLLNPTTHVRNLLGNAFMSAMIESRDKLMYLAEKALPAEQRTKAGKVKAETLKLAKEYYDTHNVADDMGGAKYELGRMNVFGKDKRVFKSKFLNFLDKKTFGLLALEDNAFKKARYAKSLARFMDARGLTEVTPEAHAYAVQDALEATFQDHSTLAAAINKVKRTKGGGVVDIIVPFTKTPINITKRAIEYSPFGLGKAGWEFYQAHKYAKDIRSVNDRLNAENLSGAQKQRLEYEAAQYRKQMREVTGKAIKTLAQGVTGTGVFTIGALLAGSGIISGLTPDPAKEQDFLNETGWQPLALHIGDVYISLDWAAPLAPVLLAGAAAYHTVAAENSDISEAGIQGAIALGDAIMNASMLKSLKNTISNKRNFGEVAAGIAADFAAQHIPTLGGKLNAITEPYAVSGYSKNVFENTKNRAIMAIPGLRQTLEAVGLGETLGLPKPKTDAWGNFISNGDIWARLGNNLLNPSKITAENSDSVTKEIKALYGRTKSTEVFPIATPTGSVAITRGGETKTAALTERQSAEMKQKISAAYYKAVSEYVKSPEYKTQTDETRVDRLNKIYKTILQGFKEQYVNMGTIPEQQPYPMLPTDSAVRRYNTALKSGIRRETLDEIYRGINSLPVLAGKDSVTIGQKQFYVRKMLAGQPDNIRKTVYNALFGELSK